jgi:hypothetical protein
LPWLKSGSGEKSILSNLGVWVFYFCVFLFLNSWFIAL